MFASFGNHLDCVVQLLKNGASLSKPNGIGDTPFEIAINKGHLAIQYAMEDFLKEEIERSISATTETKLSNNINNSNSTITIPDKGLVNGTSNSILLNNHCNGFNGDMPNGENGSYFKDISNNHLSHP